MAGLEYTIAVGQKRLRCGYTTGTCAAAAAGAAAEYLLTGRWPALICIDTPAGIPVEAEPTERRAGPDWASCAVRKDGGDDPDVTSGTLIVAHVARTDAPGIWIDGGEGVGRVTRPGLDQPVGAAAINSVPRRMITRELEAALARTGGFGGFRVLISAPEGERLAQKTFNPRLGIEGGISILGTSGIVRPMSEAALVDSITLELDMAKAAGIRALLVTPGNYGMDYARNVLNLDTARAVSCSNYLGAAIDRAAGLGFESVLLVGHLGKLIKAAAGAMNTHSQVADGRREALTAHTALCGGDAALLRAVYDSPTTDAALALLEPAGLLRPVMAAVTGALYENLRHRAGAELDIQAVVFSNRFGLLGQTPGVELLLARHRRGEGG